MALSCGVAISQTTAAQQTTTALAINAKSSRPMAFEVVSIRRSPPGTQWSIRWVTAPDGYIARGQSLRSTLMLAYFPGGMAYWSDERLSGAPSWLDDLYDIDAKVSEADLAEWQKQGVPLDQKQMLQQMLQTMLAERCKLVLHSVPATIPGYALEVGKDGPKLAETKADEKLPEGVRLAKGGVVVPYKTGEKVQSKFFGVTMESFTNQLSTMSIGRPVQDKTGLTGRYTFVLPWINRDPNDREGYIDFNDPDPLSHWDLGLLGLKIEPTKIPTEKLVIDHIEKPSEN